MLNNDDIMTPFGLRYEYKASSATYGEGINDFLRVVQENKSSMDAGQRCRLHWFGHFPLFIQFRLADASERACSMSDGDWFLMYSTYIELGLRFPLPEFLLRLLRYFGIALTQLCPNAVQEELAFMTLCVLQQVECRV